MQRPACQAIEMAPYMRVMLEAPRPRLSSSGFRGVHSAVLPCIPVCTLQVGYEALHNSGHRRSELKGWKCGVFCGDSGPVPGECQHCQHCLVALKI